MQFNIENLIIKSIFSSGDYTVKALNYLKDLYFEDSRNQLIFKIMNNYIQRYNTIPELDFILVELDKLFNDDSVSDTLINESKLFVRTEFKNKLDISEKIDYVVEATERWVRNRAYKIALEKSIENMEKNPQLGPELMSEALAITFDNKLGHDYLEDAAERLEFLNKDEIKIPFHLKMLNHITHGGVELKTINILLSGTNVGKTLFKCDWAAHLLGLGYNCLYITLEMAEEKIAQRIDANLLDVDMLQAKNIDKDIFVSSLHKKVTGRLIIKEYPATSATVLSIKALVKELQLRKQFKPNIIFVDYLNLLTSKRMKDAGNSYGYIKAVVEELRGLAMELNLPIITSTQATRGGHSNTDLDLEDVSESKATSDTADFLFALMTNEELEFQNRLLVKQLKSRYGDKTKNKKFHIGINRDKMQLYDVDNNIDDIQSSIYEPFTLSKAEEEKFKKIPTGITI